MEKTVIREQLFTEAEIKLALSKLNVVPSVNCIERMKFGDYSDMFRNMRLSDDLYKDGKVKLTKNDSGDIQVNFNFLKQDLTVPHKILNHELSEEEKKRLTQGEAIKLPKKDLFVKIDKDTNSITVSTGKELGIPETIGKYNLSHYDKELLANGKQMPPKVLEGPEGFFIANISISDNKQGLTFSNIKSITKEEAQDLIKQLNIPVQPESSLSSNVAATIAEAIEPQKGELTNNIVATADNSISDQQSLDDYRKNGKKEVIAENVRQAYLNNDSIALNDIKNDFPHLNSNSEILQPVFNDPKVQGMDKEDLDYLNSILNHEKSLSQEQEIVKKELFEAVKEGDFVKVQALGEKGNGINEQILNDLAKASNLSFEDKVTALTVLNKEPKDYLKEIQSTEKMPDQSKSDLSKSKTATVQNNINQSFN